MGTNKGSDYEKLIKSSIDQKTLSQMDNQSSDLIKKLFPKYEQLKGKIFYCFKEEGLGIERKTDLIIKAGDQLVNISVKGGNSGHSIHQEKLTDFISFIDEIEPLNSFNRNLILKFHWCDGTLDNTGEISERKGIAKYKKLFSKEYEDYCKYFSSVKDYIFERVVLGKMSPPSFLVYVTDTNSFHARSMEEVNKLHLDKKSPWGLFSFQNCWACLQGQDHGHESHICDSSCPKIKPKSKKHRLDIQFKWGKVYRDLFE